MIFSRELKRLHAQSVKVVIARGKILDLTPLFLQAATVGKWQLVFCNFKAAQLSNSGSLFNNTKS